MPKSCEDHVLKRTSPFAVTDPKFLNEMNRTSSLVSSSICPKLKLSRGSNYVEMSKTFPYLPCCLRMLLQQESKSRHEASKDSP